MHGVEVEEAAGMDGVHRQRSQAVQWRTFDSNADGDERIIDGCPAVSNLVVRARARDLEVSEIDELGESRDEGGNVCRCVEQRRVLLHEKVLHLPASVLWCLVFRGAVLGVLDLGFVYELKFGSGLWVNDWRQEGLGGVRHVEGEGLDVASYPGKRFKARGLGEGG